MLMLKRDQTRQATPEKTQFSPLPKEKQVQGKTYNGPTIPCALNSNAGTFKAVRHHKKPGPLALQTSLQKLGEDHLSAARKKGLERWKNKLPQGRDMAHDALVDVLATAHLTEKISQAVKENRFTFSYTAPGSLLQE
jgi:hypothetical protein